MFGLNASEAVESVWHALGFLMIIPAIILLLCETPSVESVHDFTFSRMQQYEISGVLSGAIGHAVNMESVVIKAGDASLLKSSGGATNNKGVRRAGIVHWKELLRMSVENLLESGAISALLIILPSDWTRVAKEELDEFQQIEKQMLATKNIRIPVLFSSETAQWSDFYANMQPILGNSLAGSFDFANLLLSDHYYVSGATQTTKQNTADNIATNILVKLYTGAAQPSASKPIALIISHYDSFGIAPSLSKSLNSAVSSTSAALELLRSLQFIMMRDKSLASYEIWFLFAGHGKFNYLGLKKFLESTPGMEGAESDNFSDRLKLAICLEGLGTSEKINVHYSKPPRNNTKLGKFVNRFDTHIHRKINLADETLSWPHERFSLHKQQAVTLSNYEAPNAAERSSITDEKLSVGILRKNIQFIGNQLLRELYNVDVDMFPQVKESSVRAWIETLSSLERSTQGIVSRQNNFLTHLHQITSRYALSSVEKYTLNEKDGDVVFYYPLEHRMALLRSKHIAFDMLLALIVAAYVGGIYVLFNYANLWSAIDSFASVMPARFILKREALNGASFASKSDNGIKW